MQDTQTENKNTEDAKEKIQAPMQTKIKSLPVRYSMMLPRRTIQRIIKTNMGIINVHQEKEGTGGSLIARIQSLQTAGAQEHTIWIALIVVFAVLMGV